MKRILSTYLFVKRKLTPALVADIAASGVNAVEMFCARAHFDYRSADVVRELASALRDHNLACTRARSHRARFQLDARKRRAALDLRSRTCAAPRSRGRDQARARRGRDISFPYLVQHMGSSRDPNDPRRFDAAFNSLEHLHIFAKQRGVTIALENTPGELATPANLRQFIADTRLTDLRLCFDIGHAHLGDGVEASLETMRELVVTAHIHDNHGEKDEHLRAASGDGKPMGASGAIDWKAALAELPSRAAGFRAEGAARLRRTDAGLGVARSARGAFERSSSARIAEPDADARRTVDRMSVVTHRARRRAPRPGSHAARLALQPARIGQAALPHFSRRHGHRCRAWSRRKSSRRRSRRCAG